MQGEGLLSVSRAALSDETQYFGIFNNKKRLFVPNTWDEKTCFPRYHPNWSFHFIWKNPLLTSLRDGTCGSNHRKRLSSACSGVLVLFRPLPRSHLIATLLERFACRYCLHQSIFTSSSISLFYQIVNMQRKIFCGNF